MRGVQQVFSVSLRVLTILGLVLLGLIWQCTVARRYSDYYRSTSSHSYSAVIASYLCSNDSEVALRRLFQGFQYMVPTGTSQIFEQIFRVSSMVGLALLHR